MIKPVCKDIFFLSQKSVPAAKEDLPVCRDLADTLAAHEDCIGMAANMIGVNKNIIAVKAGRGCLVLLNPVILSKSGPYDVREGCLSLPGMRKTVRYEKITVEFQDQNFKKRRQTFSGLAAQVIQHEIDHLSGILI
ncbi:MAG: peptide deformylase [Erysipelotrichaceae bacterium]|nr:peptide deformylase [Erysipelotrichaceae bacterium]